MPKSALVSPTMKIYSQSMLVVLVVFLAAIFVKVWHQELPLRFTVRERPFPFVDSIDSEQYLKIAQGDIAQVQSPFSKRAFYPWLASASAKIFDVPLASAFLWVNLLSFLALAFCLAEILRITTGKPLTALLFLLTPLVLEGFELAYMPDLFHMALTSLFFLLLLQDAKKLCLLVLFVCFMARENTLLLCLFTAGLGWIHREKLMAFGSLVVLIGGMIATFIFGKMGQPNPHHLPDFLYMLGKVPYYLLLNLFGVRIWSSVRADAGTPLVTWHLPNWTRIGTDNMVGITAPDWHFPVLTLIVWLTVFGVGPAILWFLLRDRGDVKSLPFAVKLALIYGLFSFFLGPFLGDWIGRLTGYGWPAFWIAMPALFCMPGRRFDRWQIHLLGAAYWLASWWPNFIGYDYVRYWNPKLCIVVPLFYLLIFLVLKVSKNVEDGKPLVS